ncbi:MAG: AAA family ATPase [Opitutales bacterium]|nr:AAA family ATPase [Opitutales bacterium]
MLYRCQFQALASVNILWINPLDQPTQVELYRKLKDFTEKELRLQREAHETLLALPETERVARGKCVPAMTFTGVTKDGMVRLEGKENPSDFREMDRVIIHQENPLSEIGELEWYRDGQTKKGEEFIELRPSSSKVRAVLREGMTYTLDLAFFDLKRFYGRTLEELGETERGRERILPLLLEEAPRDEIDPERYDESMENAEAEGHDDSQQEAIAEGVSAEWCCLIQGPPGTGKTRVLANIVKQRVERGERILVTALTHRAIHEALRKIREAMPGFENIVKIGQPVYAPDLPVPQYESFVESPLKNEAGAYVIGATPFVARGKRLSGVDFDCVVMDEASQMSLPLAIMGMLSAEVYIIVGDSKQLPPVLQSVAPGEAENFSIFRALEKNRERVILTHTYRMNAEIAAWSGERFYRSALQAAPQVAERRLALSRKALGSPWIGKVLDPQHSLVWVSTNAPGTRHYSMEEATAVRDLVQTLWLHGVKPTDIGVVTPFRRQARIIRSLLRKPEGVESDLFARLVVDTVERMQGQEREVVLVSTAASDPGFLRHLRDFLYLPARLNVAVSRAKTKVILLASRDFLPSLEGEAYAENEDFAHWRSLREASLVVEL